MLAKFGMNLADLVIMQNRAWRPATGRSLTVRNKKVRLRNLAASGLCRLEAR